ncbi:MAG TPA: hypothetical protein PK340_01225 [Bacilli bacterium]|nr:hypothetical protein [Bacilli bacterium]
MTNVGDAWKRRNKVLGDVHPFFDTEKRQLFLFYLATDGSFSSRLSTSKNMKDFVDVPMTFAGTPRAPYFVVAPLKHEGIYYTWFGQQFTHVCSKSEDGITWQPSVEFDIEVDRDISNRGERDPYVLHDSSEKCFYLVALSYPHQNNDCDIILRRTLGDSLDKWAEQTKRIVNFYNGDTWNDGEPECPQLYKIGRRWYLFASLARKTAHHVGGMSYWIGELDKTPFEVDWSSLPRHELTSEDLCAAQLFRKGKQTLLFGWISQEALGYRWGGTLNSPLRVKASKTGKLYTCFAKNRQQNRFATTPIDNIDSINLKHLHTQFIIPGDRFTMTFANGKDDDQHIVVDRFNRRVFVASTPFHIEHASLTLPKSNFIGLITVDALIYDDIIEVNVNGCATIHARMSRPLAGDKLLFSSVVTNAVLESSISSL